MMSEYNHKWIVMEDGSHNELCVKCSNKAEQSAMHITLNINVYINNEHDIKQIAKALNEQIKNSMRINSPLR
jgi:hypothetical protein